MGVRVTGKGSRMRGITGPKKLSSAALAAMALCLCAGAANAATLRKLTIQNDTPRYMSVAFIWYNAKSDKWIVDGWYRVRPGGGHSCGTYSEKIYYYAYSEQGVWGGDCNDPETSRQTVVKEKMYFEAGRPPRSGTDRRSVCFNWIRFGNRTEGTWRLHR